MSAESKVPEIRFKGFSGEWEEEKLGDISESLEYGLNAAAIEYDGKNKYLRITDINEDSRKFNFENVTSPNVDLSLAENYKLEAGDILFARTGASVGKTYIYKEEDGIVYFAGFLIRAKIKKRVNSGFIFQCTLTNEYEKFIRITSQRSGQPGVNAQEYSCFVINLPCQKEQTKTGNYFQQLDTLITQHQKKHDKLLNLKKSLLEKMFPKQGAEVPEIRFKEFNGEWEEKALGEVGELKNGMNFSKEAMGHGHPFVNLQDVFGKNVVSNNGLGFAVSTATQRKDYSLQKGDVLFIRSSVKPEGVGEAAVINKNLENTTYSGFIIRFRPNIEMAVNFNRFIYSTTNIRKQILASATSSANTNINQESLQQIQLALPEFSEQTKIGNLFKYLDTLLTQHQTQLKKLKQIKQACLKKMFV